MNYWLLKSDPDEYSWEDLMNEKDKTVGWDGIRNYQARNYLREMRKGDQAFFYHSRVNPQIICGIVEIVNEAYPDPAQFDPDSSNYDTKSDPSDPKWVMVDIRYKQSLEPPVSRDELKAEERLRDMVLFRNSRLSVQPVTKNQWNIILKPERK